MEGTFFEGGPFIISMGKNSTTSININPTRWSRFANVLYFETPVGVGFSYRDDNQYKDNNDENTALRNMFALKKFVQLYPELSNCKLYLTGESYAGIYIPMLALNILNDKIKGTWSGPALSGIVVGNGCTGISTGVCSNACNGCI